MTEFYADILDANGARIGDGPLVNIASISDTKRLDAIGEASFVMPAQDERAQYISAGSQFDLFDSVDGYLGRFPYRTKSMDESSGEAMLNVGLWDQLKELAQDSVYFRRKYYNTLLTAVVADIIGLYPGWSVTSEAVTGITGVPHTDTDKTAVIFEGQSGIAALDVLRDSWNVHFRLNAARQLGFGAFGQSCGVKLTNLCGQVQNETPTEIAIVESINLVEEADEIWTRIVPLGAGQGTAQLTLGTVAPTLGTYTVQVGDNKDGSHYYYLEDALARYGDGTAAHPAYGLRTKILTFPEIRPTGNTASEILNAVNSLKLVAEALFVRHLIPKVVYSVTVRGLRKAVLPGDLIRLNYVGKVPKYAYINLDQDFYVIEMQRNRNVNGDRSANLTIATIAEQRVQDSDIIIDVISDLRALKVHVPITMAYAPVGPYTLRMDSTHDAEFTVRIGGEVTELKWAKLRFRTSPLKSSVTTVASGGGSTSGSSSKVTADNESSHTHDITVEDSGTGVPMQFNVTGSKFTASGIGAGKAKTSEAGVAHGHGMDHTHPTPDHAHDPTYGIYADTNYPQNISIEIDGVDRTTALGGTWAPTNASYEVELDITSFLNLDLRKNHRIAFSCTAGRGEIECEVDMLVSIQAIVLS